jgi:retinol-binding protein 3
MKTIAIIARVLVILILSLFVLQFFASAQQLTQQSDMTIDAATRAAVIENLIKELNNAYVFAETAKKMELNLRDRIKNKEYDAMTSAKAFAEKLTADVQSVSKDKHLRVRYSDRPIPLRPDHGELSAEERAEFERSMRFENFGFERVERLRGNIGYIELFGFFGPQLGAETVRSAMGFVANSDALIFDLRRNGGGDPEMVALICSYLFGDKPVHLNDLFWRQAGKTDEFWTDPKVPGSKFIDKPVYVLTSNRTFSGAEEFSYNLKNLKRAVIVGETTGGGAHPGGSRRLHEHFQAFVPIGRAISPITKTNWEGTGVEPDVKVPKEHALHTAQLLALNAMLKDAKTDDRKALLNRLIGTIQGELDKIKAERK